MPDFRGVVLFALWILSGAPAHATTGHAAGADHAAGMHAPSPEFSEAAALKLSQQAIGRVLDGAWRFTSSEGQAVTLAELRGKPLVISLIYTSCYHVCPTITGSVARTVKVAREALGDASFNVVTIGFDTAVDTPERMRAYAKERGMAGAPWQFLSTDVATMEKLAQGIGFTYFRSPKGFDHMSQVTIVDAQGKVYRHVYGENFAVPTLVEPLKDLVFGRKASTKNWDGWINGVKLFCTVYDPSSGRYKFDYSLFIAIASGLISLGVMAWIIVRAWRQGGPQRPA